MSQEIVTSPDRTENKTQNSKQSPVPLLNASCGENDSTGSQKTEEPSTPPNVDWNTSDDESDSADENPCPHECVDCGCDTVCRFHCFNCDNYICKDCNSLTQEEWTGPDEPLHSYCHDCHMDFSRLAWKKVFKQKKNHSDRI